MTHDITDDSETDYSETDYSQTTTLADHSAPPLCLVHYFTERGHGPPAGPARSLGRVAARDGNLIILEWAAPPKHRPGRRKLSGRLTEALTLLLLLGCLAAFRF